MEIFISFRRRIFFRVSNQIFLSGKKDVDLYNEEKLFYLTLETSFVCAGIVYSIFLFLISQILQELSWLHVTMWYPSGDQSTPVIPCKLQIFNTLKKANKKTLIFLGESLSGWIINHTNKNTSCIPEIILSSNQLSINFMAARHMHGAYL